MSAQAAEAPPRPARGLLWLERLGLTATRALSALGLSALLFLAVLTLVDGLARWLLNQPIEGVRDVAAVAIALAVSCCLPVGLMERSNIVIRALPVARWPRISRTINVTRKTGRRGKRAHQQKQGHGGQIHAGQQARGFTGQQGQRRRPAALQGITHQTQGVRLHHKNSVSLCITQGMMSDG